MFCQLCVNKFGQTSPHFLIRLEFVGKGFGFIGAEMRRNESLLSNKMPNRTWRSRRPANGRGGLGF